ncbi:MAG: site-2 protease family protein [Acidimicrobiales bacterium]
MRSLKTNPRLPTYVIFGAIGVLVIALVIKHHWLNLDTLIFILVFLPAVILHEVSHGVVALWCGDDTAKRAGRLTLNPIKHIDPVGTILVPVVLALTHGPIFGWAKPVPVNVGRLRHPRNQSVLVALAGPTTNVILAAIAGVAMHELLVHVQTGLVFQVVYEFGIVNVILAVFNLIPIPPLDGSALVERLLPASALPTYYQVRMGFMVLILLLFFFDYGLLSGILDHFANWYLSLVASGTRFSV